MGFLIPSVHSDRSRAFRQGKVLDLFEIHSKHLLRASTSLVAKV